MKARERHAQILLEDSWHVSSGYSALAEARNAIDRIAQRRKEAMATLHGMGYPAPLRRDPLERAGE